MHLANFLKKGLNERYFKLLAEDANLIGKDPEPVVKSVRAYDALNIPLSEFPLLKVYRLADEYRPETTYCESPTVITYNTSFAKVDELPGIMRWCSLNINELLLEYKINYRNLMPYRDRLGFRAEHRIAESILIKAVYPYLRFNVRLKNC